MVHSEIIQRTLRVPLPASGSGDGAAAVRRLDAALLPLGFALTGGLRARLEALEPDAVLRTALPLLAAVRELAGAGAEHNVYFADFPENVPDTVDFWLECLVGALTDPAHRDRVDLGPGGLDLLSLPAYGRHRHTYAELAAVRDAFVAGSKDRWTLLHPGGTPEEEARLHYTDLAGSTVPLSGADRDLLGRLAAACPDHEPPAVPVRENRAVVNAARVRAGHPPLLDTVTDVLRLAQALSDGDPTLVRPARLRSFTRRERRLLLTALDGIVAADPGRLADVGRRVQGWKRLGEGLHPHEYPALAHARDVFAVARGDKRVRTLAARVETAFRAGDVPAAVDLLSAAPGTLVRSLDRIMVAGGPAATGLLVERLEAVGHRVSGRVLASAREQLANRSLPGSVRLFANESARGWTARDTRTPLPEADTAAVTAALDALIARRLPGFDLLLVDPAVRDVAVPRSGRGTSGGLGVLPRGSVTAVEGERLRFFVHWVEGQGTTTDLDLSVMMLGEDFSPVGQVSWTNLKADGVVHSGDLVEAPAPGGATEMIDIELGALGPQVRYVVPQVLVYSGDRFTYLPEAFFGYMALDAAQRGMPFEPRAVRVRSDLEGESRVLVPLAFARGADGTWSARWLHLFLAADEQFNRVEDTGVPGALLARGVLTRRYLTVGDLVGMMAERGTRVREAGPLTEEEAEGLERGELRVGHLGTERPEGLPEGVESITLPTLASLLPDTGPEPGPVG
ncbi:TerD family protein [Nocardiopsis flavescens]